MNKFISQIAPDFTANAVMPDNSIIHNFNLKNHLNGQKAVIFFYPLDFTFVCPSEIIAFNNRLGEFSSRRTKVVAISVDSHFAHHAWKETEVSKGGIGNIQFPIISDLNKEISTAYDVLNSEGISYRATFLIDDDFKIRHFLVNDLPLGRNIDDVLRIIDALDHYTKNGEVCPAGWSKGKAGINPTKQGVSDYLTSYAEDL